MNPTNCLNCATLLTADDQYCPTCGQKTHTHRLSMSHIWHDLTHAITHTDKGFFYTIKELTLRPGMVAKEYIKGKRKKYFNPFSFLVIILGIYIISNGIFKPIIKSMEYSRPKISTAARSEAAKKKYEGIMRRSKNYVEFINNKINIVLFISTPFIAFILWLLYKRKGLNYAEHLATVAYINGYLAILSIAIFTPFLYFVSDAVLFRSIYILMIFAHVIYIGFVYHGLFGYSSTKAYLKTTALSMVAIASWGLFSVAIGTLYIMFGP